MFGLNSIFIHYSLHALDNRSVAKAKVMVVLALKNIWVFYVSSYMYIYLFIYSILLFILYKLTSYIYGAMLVAQCYWFRIKCCSLTLFKSIMLIRKLYYIFREPNTCSNTRCTDLNWALVCKCGPFKAFTRISQVTEQVVKLFASVIAKRSYHSFVWLDYVSTAALLVHEW